MPRCSVSVHVKFVRVTQKVDHELRGFFVLERVVLAVGGGAALIFRVRARPA